MTTSLALSSKKLVFHFHTRLIFINIPLIFEYTWQDKSERKNSKMNFYFKFLLKFILHCPQTKLHNKTPTLGKTAQRNHNTGQNRTTKSQHWAKLHNEITTLDKTVQPNHNTGQNCTTKSQRSAGAQKQSSGGAL